MKSKKAPVRKAGRAPVAKAPATTEAHRPAVPASTRKRLAKSTPTPTKAELPAPKQSRKLAITKAPAPKQEPVEAIESLPVARRATTRTGLKAKKKTAKKVIRPALAIPKQLIAASADVPSGLATAQPTPKSSAKAKPKRVIRKAAATTARRPVAAKVPTRVKTAAVKISAEPKAAEPPPAEAALSPPVIKTKRVRRAARKAVVVRQAQPAQPEPISVKTPPRPPSAPEAEAPAAAPSARKPVLPATEPVRQPPISQRPRTMPKLPPILLEGDQPPIPASALRFGPPVGVPGRIEDAPAELENGDLPEAVSSGTFYLTARDPRCLYANWDFTDAEQQSFTRLAADHHLVLRIISLKGGHGRAAEIHLHPESRHWFIHLEEPGGTYQAELGYYVRPGKWRLVATSSHLEVPGEQAAPGLERFVTVDPYLPLVPVIDQPSESAVAQARPSMSAPQREQALTRPLPLDLPPETAPAISVPQGASPMPSPVQPAQTPTLSPWQEQALDEFVANEFLSRETIGSAEIARMLRKEAQPELSSISALPAVPEAPGQPGAGKGEIPSSQAAIPQAPAKEFWFQVNAELVIYGATEPDARVTIAGRSVTLRPDGTFSLRFALPDGQYTLPVKAEAAHGDIRSAELRFSRASRFKGDVGVHPQDPALGPPDAANAGR